MGKVALHFQKQEQNHQVEKNKGKSPFRFETGQNHHSSQKPKSRKANKQGMSLYG
jgi:hypothetical protein